MWLPCSRSLVCPILFLCFINYSFGQRSVVTWHYDNIRSGANLQENILTYSE